MPKVTFITATAGPIVVQADDGISLMRAAVDHNVPGIDADCGGSCACATCHVYIAREWKDALQPPQVGELQMLECALDPTAASRLACQIILDPSLDGLVVSVPRKQI
jgi:ferredoxin, 2Fe-2S